MPKAYSHDLRSCALKACDEEERFQIGRSSVYLWLKQRREEGRDRAKKMSGRTLPVIRNAVEGALKGLVESDNHLTLVQYRDKLTNETGLFVHPWTVGRALRGTIVNFVSGRS